MQRRVPRRRRRAFQLCHRPDGRGGWSLLWGYRHQSLVYPERGLHRRLRGAGQPRWRPWRAVADLLVAGLGRFHQVRDLRPACRQPGRGRGDGAVGPGAPGGGAVRQAADFRGGCRPDRRGAVLRRQHDHPGDLGTVGGRRAGDRLRRPGALDGTAGAYRADRPVPDPEARHRADRHPVRPGHGALVRRPGGAGRLRGDPAAGSAAGDEPCMGRAFLQLASRHRCRHPRRHRTGADRRRGAVRRHGPLRSQADRPCLVPAGAAGAGAELLPARARPSFPTPRRRATPSTCWRRAGRCCRWWRCPPWPQ